MRSLSYILLYILFTSALAFGQDYSPKKFLELVQSKNYKEVGVFLKDAMEKDKYDAALMESLLNLSSDEHLAIFEAASDHFLYAFTATQWSNQSTKHLTAQFTEKLLLLQAKKKATQKWDDWAIITNLIINNTYLGNDFELIEKGYADLYKYLDKLDTNLIGHILVLGGNYYMGVARNYEKAELFFYDLIKMKQQGRLVRVPYPYIQLADLYFRKGDFERAMEFSNKVLMANQEQPVILIEQLLSIGYIYRQQNNLAKAQEYYDKAKALFPKTAKEVKPDPFWNRAFLLYSAHYIELCVDTNKEIDKKELDAVLKGVLFFNSSTDAVIKALRALVLYFTKIDNQESFEYVFQMAKSYNVNIQVRASLFIAIGNYFYKKNDYKQALEYYDIALNGLKGESINGVATYVFDEPTAFDGVYQKTKLLMVQKKAGLSSLGIPIENLNKLIYQNIQEAILLLDDLRKSQTTKSAQLRILERTPYIYETAIQIATELYQQTKNNQYLEQVYSFMEKSKAMLLADVLAENDAKEFGGVPEKYRKEEKQLQNDLKLYELELYKAQKIGSKHQIATFENIVFEKRGKLDDLKKKLEKEYPKYFQYKFSNPVASVKDLQATLQEHNAVFVSYFTGKNNVYVLKISPNSIGIRQIPLPNNLIPNLDIETRSFRSFLSEFARISNITNDDYQKFASQAHRFYKFLLEPELKNCKNSRLLLSFDGILHYIPAEVFLTAAVKNNESVDYANLPYLIRQFTISYTYNATLWLKAIEQQKNLKSTNGGILGMAATYKPADINKNTEWGLVRSKLEELGGAKNEINFLKNTFVGKYWLDGQATEAQFLKDAPNHSVIHLALHGIVDGELPMNSGLVFTDNGDTTSNNVLQAYELPNVSLNANLVILSACSTGDGQYANGEGVMSLGRSFMYAGASSIMTSLWQLNDLSSDHLMQIFYQKLKEGLPKDEALQQAKLEYLSQAQGVAGHPAFWAALVLIGENSPAPIYSQWGTIGILGGFAALLLVAGVFWYRKKNN